LIFRRRSLASGGDNMNVIPSHDELVAWPKDRICAIAAGLAQAEGYMAERLPLGCDRDLVLKRPGQPAPEVFVCCVSGAEGVISARRMRDLVDALATQGVDAGWFISPRGFAHDAQSYGARHKLHLIDGKRLLARLNALPSRDLPKLMAVEEATEAPP